jgi:hypothetical protein
MVATLKNCIYLCGVKSRVRYESAAKSSFFCAHHSLIRYSRIKVCGSSNAHKVFAHVNLTAPCAAFCLMSNLRVL